jgi:hypothetical protein
MLRLFMLPFYPLTWSPALARGASTGGGVTDTAFRVSVPVTIRASASIGGHSGYGGSTHRYLSACDASTISHRADGETI